MSYEPTARIADERTLRRESSWWFDCRGLAASRIYTLQVAWAWDKRISVREFFITSASAEDGAVLNMLHVQGGSGTGAKNKNLRVTISIVSQCIDGILRLEVHIWVHGSADTLRIEIKSITKCKNDVFGSYLKSFLATNATFPQ